MIEIVEGLGQKLADTHTHSTVSEDVRNGRSPEELVDIARIAGLSALVVADHDQVEGAYRAAEYGKSQNIPIQIPISSEISTADGHIVAIGIRQNIEPRLSAEDTIRQIHRQGGLVIAPHPMYQKVGKSSLGEGILLSIMRQPDSEVYLDGVEVWNDGARELARGFPNERAIDLFNTYGTRLGAPIGSSDSHGSVIARVVTSYDGDLLQAIREASTGVLLLDSDEVNKRRSSVIGKYRSNYSPEDIARMTGRIERLHQSRLKQSLAIALVIGEPGQTIDTSFLSPRERAHFERVPDSRKVGWAASRLALKCAYSRVVALPPGLFSAVTIGNMPDHNRPSGPPFIITQPDLNYSLSHSDYIGIGAVSTKPVGVDVEMVQPRKEGTLKCIASQQELDAEGNLLDRDNKIARLWTLKEAAMKGTKIGVEIKNLKVDLTRTGGDNYSTQAIYKGDPHSAWIQQVFSGSGYYFAIAHQIDLKSRPSAYKYRLPSIKVPELIKSN